jgi:chaperonin GroES
MERAMAKEPKITPLGDRILAQRLDAEETTAGGIVLPDAAKEKPQQAKVIAVGEGAKTSDGDLIPMQVKKGDIVVFTSYGGTDVQIGEEEYLILRESDVLGILEDA